MLRFIAIVATLALAAQAKIRVPDMPESLRVKPEFRFPVVEDDSKIVGGEEVTPNSIPYQVSFQDKPLFGGNPFHFCGGAVIDANNVLTAAHCCRGQNAGDVQIVAGEHTIYSEEGNEQTVDIAKIIVHEDYGSFSHENDVCILQLASPLELNDKVQGLPMPEQGQDWAAGSKAIVSGWGTLSAGGSSSRVLRSVEVPIVSQEGKHQDICHQRLKRNLIPMSFCSSDQVVKC